MSTTTAPGAPLEHMPTAMDTDCGDGHSFKVQAVVEQTYAGMTFMWMSGFPTPTEFTIGEIPVDKDGTGFERIEATTTDGPPPLVAFKWTDVTVAAHACPITGYEVYWDECDGGGSFVGLKTGADMITKDSFSPSSEWSFE